MTNLIDNFKLEIVRALHDGREDHSSMLLMQLANDPDCSEGDLREVADTLRANDPDLYARIPAIAADTRDLSPLARLELTAIFGGDGDEIYEQLVEVIETSGPEDESIDLALGCVAQCAAMNVEANIALRKFSSKMPGMMRAQGIG